VQPPLQLESPGDLHKSKSLDVYDRKAFGHASACTDDKRSSKPEESADSQSNLRKVDKGVASPPPRTQSAGEKGHAHDPMDHELLWLGIGPGLEQSTPPETPTCAESPTAAEFNIYDTAYQLEVERIREAKGRKATVYLTRRVDGKKEYQEDAYMVDAPKEHEIEGAPHKGFKSVLDAAREKERSVRKAIEEGGHVHGLSAAAQSLGEKAVQQGQEVLGEERARSMAGVVNRAMEKMTGKSEQ
jgi:[calcium/calmodulin-dependent protein kinase] kinase